MNEAWRAYAVAALAADDENGHRVPRLDSEGNPLKDEDGDPIRVWQEYTPEEKMQRVIKTADALYAAEMDRTPHPAAKPR